MGIRQWIAAGMACAALAGGANAQSGTGHDHAGPNHAAHAANPAPGTGPHGGQLQQVGKTQIETLVHLGGLRLFVYDNQGQPMDLRSARGLAMLQVKNVSKRYRYDLFAEVGENQSAESLAVAIDLSRIAGAEVQLDVQLVGIAGFDRGEAKFSVSATIPMTDKQRVAAAVAAQKVCPVSGQSLESMGGAIPVTVGGKTVYVCCAGCIDAVKDNPSKYFATKATLTVAPATNADAAAIALQKVCPVMGGPLGDMGGAIKVTGLERDVYICCKGCLRRLEANPQKYLALLPPQPKSDRSPIVKATGVDAPFVAAQKICPVMGGPLDGMGGPYRTVLNGRVVYLCCPGCGGKLFADPEKYLALLRQQGVSPPMAQ